MQSVTDTQYDKLLYLLVRNSPEYPGNSSYERSLINGSSLGESLK